MVARVLLTALVAIALSTSPATAVAPPPLELIGGEGGLQVATSITVSPNGAHAYATTADSDGVFVFARDATTGDLTFLSCVNETGAGGCTDGKALTGARSVVVSPNGAHVYVSSGDSDAVAVFTRNSSTGALTQQGVFGANNLHYFYPAVTPDSNGRRSRISFARSHLRDSV